MRGDRCANTPALRHPLGLRPPQRSAPPTAVPGSFVGYRFVLRGVAGAFPPHPCKGGARSLPSGGWALGGVDARLCARFVRTRRPPAPPALKGRGQLHVWRLLRKVPHIPLPAPGGAQASPLAPSSAFRSMWGACFANRHTFRSPLGLRPPHRSAPPTAVQGAFCRLPLCATRCCGGLPPAPLHRAPSARGAFRPRAGLFVAFLRLWVAPSLGVPYGPPRSGARGRCREVGRGPPPRPPLGAGPPPLPLAPRSLRSRPPLSLRAAGASPPWESGVPPLAGRFVALRANCASRSSRPAKRGPCGPPGGGPLPPPRGSALPSGSLSSSSSSGPRGPSVRWPPPGAYGREPPALRLGPLSSA